MEQIIAVERNYLGQIISFKTSSGRVISYRKALLDAESGIIDGVNITESTEENGLSAKFEDNFENYPLIY
ncbi:DUF3892 domain-containing protein [Niallia sp. NCCP-28]|uniref:DUF3892 domain-containing protein n=1 Tax=Niallia sp. NCCP-28 TaxID=2934712 RepID=UPI002084D6AE|nr:DUF3892 domain-containing protein [Niallia sp. NCCP-28]GKU80916.1 hypothetical protein NCCP28_03120 [Niallia sp. NCCP-28]